MKIWIGCITLLAAACVNAVARADCNSSGACLSHQNTSSNGVGILGSNNNAGGAGLKGASTSGWGVWGQTTNGTALVAVAFGSGGALYGQTESGTAIEGIANSGKGMFVTSVSSYAVHASSGNNIAIFAEGYDSPGVRGNSDTSNGVIGYTNSPTNAAISAVSPSNSGLAYWGTGGIILSGSFAQKAGGGSWTAPSDQRIKKDVRDFDQGLKQVLRVRPVTFKYNGLGGTSDDGKKYVGVIAQDLEKISPAMVSNRKAKLHQADAKETDIKQVDPSAFSYMLINAVRQQQEIIERQEARIARLEGGRAPLMSALLPGDLGGGILLGLLPLGFLAGLMTRKRQ
jgi:hypothetical protein